MIARASLVGTYVFVVTFIFLTLVGGGLWKHIMERMSEWQVIYISWPVNDQVDLPLEQWCSARGSSIPQGHLAQQPWYVILYVWTLTLIKTFKCTLLNIYGFGGENRAALGFSWLLPTGLEINKKRRSIWIKLEGGQGILGGGACTRKEKETLTCKGR